MAFSIILISGDLLRNFGGVLYAASIVFAAFSIITSAPKRTARDAALLSSIVIVYAILSYFEVFDRAWTKVYDRQVIARQVLPLIGFCIILVASHRFWLRDSLGAIPPWIFFYFLLMFLFAGALLDTLFGISPIHRVADTLRNGALSFIVITSYLAVSKRGVWLFLVPLAYIIFGAVSSYSQTTAFYWVIAIVLLGSLWRVALGRIFVVCLVVSILSATAYALISFGIDDYASLWRQDANTSWRLLFWRDAVRAAIDTHGIGIGFGTEALANYYPGMPQQMFRPDPAADPDFVMIGTHNAFFDILLRCGLLGLAVVIWIFASSVNIFRYSFTAPIAIAFAGSFLCSFVNVGLQSPLYSAGIAFALGFCRAKCSRGSNLSQLAIAKR